MSNSYKIRIFLLQILIILVFVGFYYNWWKYKFWFLGSYWDFLVFPIPIIGFFMVFIFPMKLGFCWDLLGSKKYKFWFLGSYWDFLVFPIPIIGFFMVFIFSMKLGFCWDLLGSKKYKFWFLGSYWDLLVFPIPIVGFFMVFIFPRSLVFVGIYYEVKNTNFDSWVLIGIFLYFQFRYWDFHGIYFFPWSWDLLGTKKYKFWFLGFQFRLSEFWGYLFFPCYKVGFLSWYSWKHQIQVIPNYLGFAAKIQTQQNPNKYPS